MITTFLLNGELKLVITPSNQIEKDLLLQLCKGPVDIQILDKVQIADKAYADSAIITIAGKREG